MYGIPDDAGNVLSRHATERMAEQAKGMKVDMLDKPYATRDFTLSRAMGDSQWHDETQGQLALRKRMPYRITEARLDGDEQHGRVVVTCEEVEETEAHS